MGQIRKLYLYKTWIFFLILCLCGICAPIVGVVLLWDTILYRVTFIIISIVFILYLIYAIIIGFFTPLRISDEGIKYRKIHLSWDEIRVTAYPQLNKSFQYGYYLILDNHYLRDLQSIRKKLYMGCRVYMDKKSLPIILSHCKTKILILNPSATSESMPKSNSKCNAMLIEFNKNIDG